MFFVGVDVCSAASDSFTISAPTTTPNSYGNWYMIPTIYPRSSGDNCHFSSYVGVYPDITHTIYADSNGACSDFVGTNLQADSAATFSLYSAYGTSVWFKIEDMVSSQIWYFYPMNYDIYTTSWSTTPPPAATQIYASINADGSNAVMNGDCIYGQTDAIWQMIYSDGSVSKYIGGGAGSASCTGGYSNFTTNLATWAANDWWINGWTYNHPGNYYLFYWHHSWPPSNSCKYPLTGTVSDCMADASEYAIFSQNATSSPYDTWSTTPAPPVNPTLTVTTPAGGTTITSNSTTLSGTYGALHEGELGFGYLHLKLQNPNSGIYSREYTTPLTGESGTFSTPLSNFGITENGTWNLIAQQELDANTFEDLTPSPAYTLIFNIGGNSTPYTFTNWNTWYTQNSAGGYSAPSDFGNSIEGFFQPIFTNVYEFANNTLSFFNVTTAHDKGYQIGQIFPTAQAYLDNINVFFGGFPLVPFFEFMIVVMLGIFIVRTIFKFIPFFG